MKPIPTVFSVFDYCETLEPQIKLHHEHPGQVFFVIADYQALSASAAPGAVRNATLDLAIAYLALGLEPRKAFLFRQSDVPEIMELAWALSRLVQVDKLEAVATRLEATAAGRSTLACLSDPVLWSAQVLSVRGTLVSVAPAQWPVFDLVSAIARDFNHHYGTDLFPVPKPLEAGRVLPLNAEVQMQKQVSVFDSFATIKKKVPVPQAAHDLAERFAPYREPYKKWKVKPGDVEEILRNGGIRARDEIGETIDRVRSLIGL
jgi:tryptophanyl-tRNA synthetase